MTATPAVRNPSCKNPGHNPYSSTDAYLYEDDSYTSVIGPCPECSNKPFKSLSTGLEVLDKALDGGFRPGELIAVSGPTAVGKSMAVLGFVRRAIRDDRAALFFGLESDAEVTIGRAIAADCRIPTGSVMDPEKRASLDDQTKEKIRAAAATYREGAGSRSHIADLGLLARRDEFNMKGVARLVDKRFYDLVVVDYVQMLDEGLQALPALKALALAENATVVAVVQDGAYQVKEARMMIRMYADIAIHLFRPDQEEADSSRSGEMDVEITKNRRGRLYRVEVAFQGHYARLITMSGDEHLHEIHSSRWSI
jgi:replicative DNA helicase